MKKKSIILLVIAIVLCLTALIVGLILAGVDLAKVLTSKPAILIYGIIGIVAFVFVSKKIMGDWK